MQKTDSLALLAAVAPPAGWHTELAIVSSYSVHLVAAVALVLALGGEGEEPEDMPTAGLARACDAMSSKLRILCQAGRVLAPRAHGAVLALADRWIREQPFDERTRSWHAKLALVLHRHPEHGDRWLMWIGSRNLTLDTSWDSGLLAVGIPGATSPMTPSIATIGAELADRADLPGWGEPELRRALDAVAWRWPEGVKLRSIMLSHDQQPGFPSLPRNTRRALAIAPFVDGKTCQTIASWTCEEKRLVSTEPMLAHLHRLKGSKLERIDDRRWLDTAGMDGSDTTDDDEGTPEAHRGLHAKLILLTDTSDRHQLWLGSANLTQRGWTRNVELIVRAEVSDTVAGHLHGFADQAYELDLAQLPPSPEDEQAEALEFVRKAIMAAWEATLSHGTQGISLRLAKPLPPLDGLRLQIQMLGAQRWEVLRRRVTPLPTPPPTAWTELVVLELQHIGHPNERISWVTRCDFDPPLGDERDQAVLARLMGPEAFMRWIRGMLDGGWEGEGETWPPKGGAGQRGSGTRGTRTPPLPTLESALRAWARDTSSLVPIDRAVARWGRAVATEHHDDPTLRRFLDTWAIIKQALEIG